MRDLFSHLTKRVAEQLYTEASEKEKLLFMYVYEAALLGHLCVHICHKSKKITPSIKDVIDCSDSEESALKEIFFGVKSPSNVIVNEGRYYLPKYWHCEEELRINYEKIVKTEPSFLIDEKMLLKKANEYNLTDSQKDLIVSFNKQALIMLLGGAGSGKSYAIATLIAIYRSIDPKLKIVVSAPTGKASFNLQNKVNDNFVLFTTTHSLLRTTNEKLPLNYDIIIVDEASMLDSRIFAELLKKVGRGRLLLVGDPNQLSPVNMGNIFADLSLRHNKVIFLSKNMRFSNHTIEAVANAIIEQNSQEVIDNSELFVDLNSFSFEELKHPFLFKKQSVEDMLYNLSRFQIISSFQQGIYGVDWFNNKFLDNCYAKNFLTPIIILKNDKQVQLYNGFLGVLDGYSYAYFLSKGGGIKRVSYLELPPFKPAFCLSIHKSQSYPKVAKGLVGIYFIVERLELRRGLKYIPPLKL